MALMDYTTLFRGSVSCFFNSETIDLDDFGCSQCLPGNRSVHGGTGGGFVTVETQIM